MDEVEFEILPIESGGWAVYDGAGTFLGRFEDFNQAVDFTGR